MKILHIRYILAVIIILIAGCQPVNHAGTNAILTCSITPTVAMKTSAVTPSPTSGVTEELAGLDCKEKVSATLPSDTFRGKILFYDRHQQQSWMKDLQSGEQLLFENTYAEYIYPSPSFEQVAYTPEIDYKISTLVIYDVTTASEKTFSLDEQLLGKYPHLSGWTGSDKVVFRIPGTPPEALNLLQVTTGNHQVLSPNYPDIFSLDPWQWAEWGRTVYSPDMRYVIYPILHNGFKYVIWNIRDGKEISEVKTVHAAEPPQWAPDGQKYAVVVEKEMLVAGLDESKIKVTDMAKDYPDHDLKIRLWSWSPDSTKIAIWLDFYPQGYFSLLHEERKGIYPEEKLMIVDVVTKEMRDLCINGDSVAIQLSGVGPNFSPAPIWSPDGKELLVEERLNMEESRMLIVDLEQDEAFTIEKNTYPVGWLK